MANKDISIFQDKHYFQKIRIFGLLLSTPFKEITKTLKNVASDDIFRKFQKFYRFDKIEKNN
jgi:uncharacterized protein YpbB